MNNKYEQDENVEQPIASMGWVVIGLVLALGEISPSWKELENIPIQSRRKFSLHSLTRWEKGAGNARCLNQIIYKLWRFFIKFVAPISVASIFISALCPLRDNVSGAVAKRHACALG